MSSSASVTGDLLVPVSSLPDAERIELLNEEYYEHDSATELLIDDDEKLPLLQQKDLERQGVVFHFPNYTPYVIRTLILINIAMFFVEMTLASWTFAPISQNPTLGPSSHILKLAGAKDTYRIQAFNEYWRLILPMFLHAGIAHLLLNMIALRNVAAGLESEHGHWKVLLIYVVSGLTSSLSSAVFLPRQLSVGASGAIYGLVGACAVDLAYSWSYTENRIQLLVSLAISLLLGLGLGLLPLMDNFAHLGGLFGGIFLATILLGHREIEQMESKKIQRIKLIARFICAALLGALFAFLIALLAYGIDGNEICPWCKFASCVETPWWKCEPIRCVQTMPDRTVQDIDWKYCDDLI